MASSLLCTDCDRLDAAYRKAIRQISLIVETRFRTPRDKMRKLHHRQRARDMAIEAYYVHRRQHREEGPRKRNARVEVSRPVWSFLSGTVSGLESTRKARYLCPSDKSYLPPQPLAEALATAIELLGNGSGASISHSFQPLTRSTV